MSQKPSGQRWVPPLAVIATAAILVAIYWIFERTPIEARMGVVQKIFYFHVPSAWLSFAGFLICFVASLGYLWSRRDAWDLAAATGAEVGLLFGVIVLLTGPLWARPVWGVWWKWDPRLTTMALMVLIYAAYVVLRAYGGESEGMRRLAAVLGVFGAPNIYFIHYSVQKWRGQHPTVISEKGGGLAPEMRVTLWVAFGALLTVFVLLTGLRYRTHADAREVRTMRRRVGRLGGL